MSVTRLTIGAAVVLLGVLCWLAVIGFTAAQVSLVTVAALVVLVGGGNWLGGRSTHGPHASPVSSTSPPSREAPHRSVAPADDVGEGAPAEAAGEGAPAGDGASDP